MRMDRRPTEAEGGSGHTLSYLILSFQVAAAIALAVVSSELATCSRVRHWSMDPLWPPAAVQVAVGGALVFLAGILVSDA